MTDLAAIAKKQGIKYFLISFTDLFGAQITSATRQAAIKRALLQLLAGADQATKPARAAALAG